MSLWKSIETLPDSEHHRGFFVIAPYPSSGGWSDPCFTWKAPDGSLPRWHHPFPPTHWLKLPPLPKTEGSDK